jgi:hypothetical protein
LTLYVCHVTIEFHDIEVDADTEDDAKQLAEEKVFKMLEIGEEPHDVFIECEPVD